MASPFANVPSAVERELEISSDRFKDFIHNLEHKRPGNRRRQDEIQSYLRETQLWANQFVYIHDLTSGRYYHEGLDRALGYTVDRITPDFFAHNVHPGDLPSYFEISRALLSFVTVYAEDLVPFESACHVTYRMRTAQGSYVSVLRKSTPFLKDGDGNVAAYISRCTDITHLRRDHKVTWEVFGPRSDRFSDFLETSGEEEGDHTLFTEREMDVLRLLRRGHTSAEIAEELFISVNTVNTHRKSLMRKAEVDNTVELLFFAQEHGYL